MAELLAYDDRTVLSRTASEIPNALFLVFAFNVHDPKGLMGREAYLISRGQYYDKFLTHRTECLQHFRVFLRVGRRGGLIRIARGRFSDSRYRSSVEPKRRPLHGRARCVDPFAHKYGGLVIVVVTRARFVGIAGVEFGCGLH